MQVVKFPDKDETDFYIVSKEKPIKGDLFFANSGTWEIKSIKSSQLLFRAPHSPFQTIGRAARKRILTHIDDSPWKNGINPFDNNLIQKNNIK